MLPLLLTGRSLLCGWGTVIVYEGSVHVKSIEEVASPPEPLESSALPYQTRVERVVLTLRARSLSCL